MVYKHNKKVPKHNILGISDLHPIEKRSLRPQVKRKYIYINLYIQLVFTDIFVDFNANNIAKKYKFVKHM